jgi:hypothetical protein
LISSQTEYQKAREELEDLNRWLVRLETNEGAEFKGLTAASVRKMISRVREEVAEYEATIPPVPPSSEEEAGPGDSGVERPG